nr:retrovirus-related Pol polyprotein from transposon TNT 1-94 [Tanacetum cinerariifolium]
FDHLEFNSNHDTWVDKGKTWTRVNHAQDNMKYTSTHKSMTPIVVLLKSDRKPINKTFSTARPTLKSAQPKIKSFVKTAHSNVKRPFKRKSAAKNKVWSPTVRQKIPTAGSKVPTAKPAVATDKGNKGKLLRPQLVRFGNLSKLLLIKGIPYDNIDDKGFWDIGCSRHMTRNISYLSEYEPLNGGYVSFGHGRGKITRENGKSKSLIVVFGTSGCLNVEVTLLKNWRLHSIFLPPFSFDLEDGRCIWWDLDKGTWDVKVRCGKGFGTVGCTRLSWGRRDYSSGFWAGEFVIGRLGQDSGCSRHMTGNISYLSEYEPFNGGYVSFGHRRGKITGKGSIKTVDERMLWHMRLGHLNFKSMNKLVRSNLVKGLPSKSFENDHSCIACLKAKQHNASCIKREFSNARTLQQNVVAKRRNRTLIEATRTMLADAKLPVTFRAEAVNTACYVQNRVLVTKPHNKTPYELFNERSHAIGFLRPFGCHVMILNTLDHLGKFDAKGDEGYFVGYSLSSKAFTMFNKRTKKIEENLHVDFLKNKSIEKENGSTVETEVPTVSLPVPTDSVSVPPVTSSVPKIISKGGSSFQEPLSLGNAMSFKNRLEDFFGDTSNAVSLNEVEANLSNMETAIQVSPTLTLRIHKDHPKSQIIGPVDTPIQTRHKTKDVDEQSFIAKIHQKTNPDSYSIVYFHNVWVLVDCPNGVRPIRTKWVLKNKKDERGIVIRNKARLVAQRHPQEKGIDYEEVFAPVARIEAIRLFLAYASYMGFTVYQMDVKSAFLYGTIVEEVYVMQPPSFQDLEFPHRLYKVEKTMYGLHQAPRALYGTLSKYLLDNGFQRGTIDQTLFVKKYKGDFLLVQVYTPMDKENPWGKDGNGKDVELYLYRSMIGSLMYLTALRPDIMFAVCACARHQVTPKECHLQVVKRIFRYLKGNHKLGLWYLKESPFDLVAYSDSDYGGAN